MQPATERPPPSGRQVEIRHARYSAVVVEVGAAIRRLRVGDDDVLDGFSRDEMSTSGRGQTLVPWPNRLAGGRYHFGGQEHQLPLSEPARNNAIHGLVRFANWTVAEVSDERVVMAHRLYPQPGYPFLLDLAVEYALGPEGLAVRASATNLGDGPCPYAQGAHPYLRIGTDPIDRLVLRSPATTVYHADDHGIPDGRAAVDGSEHDFRQPRPIGGTVLDTAYTALERDDDGRAAVELRDPATGRAVTLWLDAGYPYLMLFTGDTLPDAARRRRGLGVEPMTAAPNAFVSGDGLAVLEPGETMSAAWGITADGFDTAV